MSKFLLITIFLLSCAISSPTSAADECESSGPAKKKLDCFVGKMQAESATRRAPPARPVQAEPDPIELMRFESMRLNNRLKGICNHC